MGILARRDSRDDDSFRNPNNLSEHQIQQEEPGSEKAFPSFWENFKRVHFNAVPCIIQCLISEMQLQMSTVFVGNYMNDTYKLAGAGMATMMINVACISFVYGATSVLETFVS
mmetsp:Transcript_2014/g.3566  ORF Transcript_2014/g.3566 Transcript_2014/m.3566 type:complete len:113 (-) Transcript_2014:1267-1605(-)